MAVVTHAIAHHRGGYTLGRELDTIRLRTVVNGLEKDFVLELINGLAHISEHLFTFRGTLNGDTHHHGQPGYQVIAATLPELFCEVVAPVLRATFPGVDVQILHDIAMWTFLEFPKPIGDLFSDCCLRELVALQTLTTSRGGVGIACRGVADTDDEPVSFWQGFCQASVLDLNATDVLQFHAVLIRDFLSSGLRGDAPDEAAFALPLVDALLVAQSDVLQLQDGLPFGRIQILSTWCCAFRCPFKTEIASGCLGDGIGEVIVSILPTLTRGLKLLDQCKFLTIAAHKHLEPLRLEVIA